MASDSSTSAEASPILEPEGPSNSSARFPSTLRLRQPRSKTGCLTCRRRKKKCDEDFPRCIACARNRLACTWPPDRERGNGPDQPSLQTPGVSGGQRHRLANQHRQPGQANTDPPSPSSFGGRGTLVGSSGAACTLTALSGTLLQHYLAETAMLLPMRPPACNPFITQLVPQACSDDLLMHVVVALSGTHLGYKCPDAGEVERATSRHYSVVVRGLQDELSSPMIENKDCIIRLLLVLVMLCHYEVISGAPATTTYIHLRAMHQLILPLLDLNENGLRPATASDKQRTEILGFIFELYAFLVIVNTVTPFYAQDNLPYDPFVASLAHLEPYPTFGIMFAGGHGLFELIPQVVELYGRRLAEEETGLVTPSVELLASHRRLTCLVEAWRMSPPSAPKPTVASFPAGDPANAPSPLPSQYLWEWSQQCTASEVLRRALRIYLAISTTGSVIPANVVAESIQPEIDAIVQHTQLLGSTSTYISNMLWPFVVAGSCMVLDSQRGWLMNCLMAGRYRMRHLAETCKVLSLVWRDTDPKVYGPYGLHLVFGKYGVTRPGMI